MRAVNQAPTAADSCSECVQQWKRTRRRRIDDASHWASLQTEQRNMQQQQRSPSRPHRQEQRHAPTDKAYSSLSALLSVTVPSMLAGLLLGYCLWATPRQHHHQQTDLPPSLHREAQQLQRRRLHTRMSGTGAQVQHHLPGWPSEVARISQAATSLEPLPYYDIVLVVFSGDGVNAVARRDTMRRIYAAYDDGVVVMDDYGSTFSYSVKVLYVVSHVDASPDGDLVGDVLYVQCPPGYRNIVHKTKAMLAVVTHIDLRYLIKADDDTFVCFNRVAQRLHALPPSSKPKVYGGIPTACGLDSNPHIGRVIMDPQHKWHDAKFVNHTLGGLDCYPVYQQGAFYLLSAPLVKYLYMGRHNLLTFTNEDVTMGAWLMGVDRDIVAFNSISQARLWECTCAREDLNSKWTLYDKNAFFHNCKEDEQLMRCGTMLPFC